MKKKLLMVMLSTVLVLSGCGQEAAESTGESRAAVENSTEQSEAANAAKEEETSADKETAAASSTAATEQSNQGALAETQKESEKADKAETTATPEATQKPEAEKETTGTEKPTATAAPKATKKPSASSEQKKDNKPSGAAGTQTSTGNTTQSTPTSAPVVSAPTPEPHTQCSWDGGSVTQNASCASEGTKTYTCTVCGKTKTESIARTPHNYVTTTTEATCTTGGSTKTYCTNCGDVQSETTTGGGLGHDFQKVYWPSAPTCMCSGDYSMVCSRCGEGDGGGTRTDPALPHSPVDTEICHGNCTSETIVVTTCSECGLELGRNSWYEDEHDWVEGSEEVLNHVTLEYETITFTYCSRCYARQ